MKRFILIVVYLKILFLSSQKKLENAYRSLNEYNYFDARKKFHSLWNKSKNPSAAYGLSIIYGRNDNPFHQPDSAILFANRAFTGIPSGYFKKINGFEISTASIQNQINHLSLTEWNKLKQKKELPAYDHFLEQYYLAPTALLREVIIERSRIAYDYCVKHGHPDTTYMYILRYPLNPDLENFRQLYHNQQYLFLTSGKTTNDYYAFLEKFPHHPYRPQALSELFSICKHMADTTCWARFIRRFPDEKITSKAWLEYFLVSVKNGEKPEEFITRHPAFPYNQSVLQYIRFNPSPYVVYEDSAGVGVMDTNCLQILHPLYDEIVLPSENGPGYLKKNDTLKFIDSRLNIIPILPCSESEGFNGLFAAVKDFKGFWYFIFTDGSIVSDTFSKIILARCGKYIAQKNNAYALLDERANARTAFDFDEITEAGDGIFHFRKKEKYGLINVEYQMFETEATAVSNFKDGFAIASKNGKFGILNAQGKWELEPKYIQIRRYAENMKLFMCFESEHSGIYYHAAERCTLASWYSEADRETAFLKSGNGNWLSLRPADNKNQDFINAKGVRIHSPPKNWLITDAGFLYQSVCRNNKNEYRIFDLSRNKFVHKKNAQRIEKLHGAYVLISEEDSRDKVIILDAAGTPLLESEGEAEIFPQGIVQIENSKEMLLYDVRNSNKISNLSEVKTDVSGNIFVKFKDGRCAIIRSGKKNLNFENKL